MCKKKVADIEIDNQVVLQNETTIRIINLLLWEWFKLNDNEEESMWETAAVNDEFLFGCYGLDLENHTRSFMTGGRTPFYAIIYEAATT